MARPGRMRDETVNENGACAPDPPPYVPRSVRPEKWSVRAERASAHGGGDEAPRGNDVGAAAMALTTGVVWQRGRRGISGSHRSLEKKKKASRETRARSNAQSPCTHKWRSSMIRAPLLKCH